ncbi:TadE/TadG family type IV pilus assembly protein [Shimia aestuarii]|uniref:TadE/TadG family type IV pilus assembly protein n=1 Tax=Shimia aestuarii TaxID=254406 RepID=UPI001FB2251E|nr:TadE/TadG family type IV pilus assembly protein [Shimia aestuarii]
MPTKTTKTINAVRERLSRFRHDESGVLVGFSVFLFLIILLVGGIGIDLMRSEMNRTRMQHTLDRAVLAAADMGQTLDPKSVVRDYFAKSNLSETLTYLDDDTGLNYRVVTARAKRDTKTNFMKLAGIDTLSAVAAGRAEERIGGVEISLVLDVSGSMNSNSRLSNLKVAAKDFIDTMDANTEDGKLSISIVPYATQVSASKKLFDTLNASISGNMDVDTVINPNASGVEAAANQQGYSHCIHFDAEDFDTTELDPDERWTQAMHFSPWSDYDGRDNDPKQLVQTPVCRTDSGSEIMALEKNKTTLKNYINGLWAGGNTSIDVGMKWGVAMLDPSTQDIIDYLIDEDVISDDFVDRPTRYEDGDALKVIVLMTDGQNTSQYYVHDDFRSGASNIWWNDQEEIYSVYVGTDIYDSNDNDDYTDELYYWPGHNDQNGDWQEGWYDHPYGNGEITTTEWIEHVETYCKRYYTRGWRKGQCKKWGNQTSYEEITTTVSENGEAIQLQYPDLWAYTSLEWNVEEHYEPWMNDNDAWDDWFYDVRKSIGNSTKNARTKAICDAAKAKNIVVFTIGFEAPSNGRAVLKDCASTDAHYFDVDGLEISDAFSAIASSIAQLKLTQ